MSIFSLLFGKNENLDTDNNSYEIETVETVSSKVQIVYPSHMIFKSINSFVPDTDIMDIAVPIAMDIFQDDYTIYSTEKTLCEMCNMLNMNLSIRKELYILNNETSPIGEAYESIAYSEIRYFDNLFIDKIRNSSMNIDDYSKFRNVLLSSFKLAGKTDMYFNILSTVSCEYFSEHNIENLASLEIPFDSLSITEPRYASNVLYIYHHSLSSPSADIMGVIEPLCINKFSSKYDCDYILETVCKIVSKLDKSIKDSISNYKEEITAQEYLKEIEYAILETDKILINLLKENRINESIYLSLQEILLEAFEKTSLHDIYMASLYNTFASHIEKNIYFKTYISERLYDIFS